MLGGKNLRIGFFTDTYFPQVSGVSTSIETLKNELIKRGHEVYIFTTTDPNAKENEENVFRLPSVPFISFPERRITYSGLNHALDLAIQHQIDIVHTHTEFSLGLIAYAIAKILNLPHIHTYHTMYENYTHYIFNGRLVKARHVRMLSHFFCQRTDAIVAPSEMTKEKLRSYKISRPIRVIPTGVKIHELDLNERLKTRKSLGYNCDDLVFLSLSRLSKEKGIDHIVQAFPEIIKLIPNAQLLIVGDGPYRAELEKLSQDLKISKYVQFTGQVESSDVWKYYQASDIFINASRSESQGLTYLEALANHLPVIAPYNDYLAEIINRPEFGQLYEWGENLAQVVKNYLDKNKENSVSIQTEDLTAISSEEFARRIEEYYIDIKKTKNKN